MSDVIKLLPDSVANQIAAGEVIQRPASVIKELVENSIDAGADTVKIIIKDAGRTLIQVVDNGCGMSTTDARLAFERHSTSKITVANDLFTLHTMGFRGEALASIAAVSQVELKTMRRDDSIGTRLVISGSRVEAQEPTACAPGSNMAVKNLFFNVPARRKFLKKDSVELNNILREFERLALVNPNVDLTIIHNDSVLHQLLRGSLKQRIGALFGKSVERQLIPIGTETSIVKIDGFIGLPEHSRKRGALQYLFVNGRNMRHPYFHKAVMHCYEHLIRPDEQPNYFINFVVDPSTIDVNIHPTKNEIKFENEQPIWQILVAAVRESLGKFNVAPAIDFDVEDAPDIPAFNPNPNARLSDFNPVGDYNPFAPSTPSTTSQSGSGRGSSDAAWQKESRRAVNNWEKLYAQFQGSDTSTIAPESPADIPTMPDDPANDAPAHLDIPSGNGSEQQIGEQTRTLMQLKNKYILTPSRNGLLIVDQYRAHYLVLYEQFINRVADKMPTQKVMFPEIFTLSPQQHILLHEILPEVEAIGFELAPAGPNAWSIEGVPAIELNDTNDKLIKSILDDLAEGTDVTTKAIRHSIATHIARSGAIRGGRQLTEAEMDHLLSSLFSLPTPNYTPDGLRVLTEISAADLEHLF